MQEDIVTVCFVISSVSYWSVCWCRMLVLDADGFLCVCVSGWEAEVSGGQQGQPAAEEDERKGRRCQEDPGPGATGTSRHLTSLWWLWLELHFNVTAHLSPNYAVFVKCCLDVVNSLDVLFHINWVNSHTDFYAVSHFHCHFELGIYHFFLCVCQSLFFLFNWKVNFCFLSIRRSRGLSMYMD